MEYTERNSRINSVGSESLVWVQDNSGREFSCSLDTFSSNVRSINDLNQHERNSCQDINLIVGTERW